LVATWELHGKALDVQQQSKASNHERSDVVQLKWVLVRGAAAGHGWLRDGSKSIGNGCKRTPPGTVEDEEGRANGHREKHYESDCGRLVLTGRSILWMHFAGRRRYAQGVGAVLHPVVAWSFSGSAEYVTHPDFEKVGKGHLDDAMQMLRTEFHDVAVEPAIRHGAAASV